MEIKGELQMGKYFGTDGVRGVANSELTPEIAFKLGRFGGYVLAKKHNSENPKVLVGRDTRVSGEMLESALIAGLSSIGAEVMRLGVISTPGVAYLTKEVEADLGVMISASHNPVADNGIKFFGPDGFKLTDDEELEIETKSNPNDLVTNMDKETEERLFNNIKATYPEHFILGEEGHGKDIENTKGVLWIMDPIDGTLNFVHQKENFAISKIVHILLL